MGFRHDASAAAFGGFLTRPFSQPLATQASSVLSPVGGYASARVENYRFEGIVSFDLGYTQVMGTQRQDANGKTVYETMAMAVVEGLNILDVIRADRVVSRFASAYTDGTPADELPFMPIGSHFLDLRIAGTRLGASSGELQPRSDLVQHCTASAILNNCSDARKARSPHKFALPLFDLTPFRIPGARLREGTSTIDLDSFGTITIGEFSVSPTDRALNMIVVDLHSPEAGMLALGPVRGNGSPN